MTSSSNSPAIFTTWLFGPAVPISCICSSGAPEGSFSNGHPYPASPCRDPQHRQCQITACTPRLHPTAPTKPLLRAARCSASWHRGWCHQGKPMVCHLWGTRDSDGACALLCMDGVETCRTQLRQTTGNSRVCKGTAGWIGYIGKHRRSNPIGSRAVGWGREEGPLPRAGDASRSPQQ